MTAPHFPRTQNHLSLVYIYYVLSWLSEALPGIKIQAGYIDKCQPLIGLHPIAFILPLPLNATLPFSKKIGKQWVNHCVYHRFVSIQYSTSDYLECFPMLCMIVSTCVWAQVGCCFFLFLQNHSDPPTSICKLEETSCD